MGNIQDPPAAALGQFPLTLLSKLRIVFGERRTAENVYLSRVK
jgi:hypothetical protein